MITQKSEGFPCVTNSNTASRYAGLSVIFELLLALAQNFRRSSSWVRSRCLIRSISAGAMEDRISSSGQSSPYGRKLASRGLKITIGESCNHHWIWSLAGPVWMLIWRPGRISSVLMVVIGWGWWINWFLVSASRESHHDAAEPRLRHVCGGLGGHARRCDPPGEKYRGTTTCRGCSGDDGSLQPFSGGGKGLVRWL